jgi:hypothetical protein
MTIIWLRPDSSEVSMNSIDNRIAIRTMAVGVGARSISEPSWKTACQGYPNLSNLRTQPKPVQTDVSFSTYGSKHEHLAVKITNKETGEVVREIPSRETQKLHVHLEALV